MWRWRLTDDYATEWLKGLVRVWQEKDVPGALALFAGCRDYRESPFSDNAASVPDGIRELWLTTLNQSSINVQTSVIATTHPTLVAAYNATYVSSTDGIMVTAGIWIAEFSKGNCIRFRQWYMTKN